MDLLAAIGSSARVSLLRNSTPAVVYARARKQHLRANVRRARVRVRMARCRHDGGKSILGYTLARRTTPRHCSPAGLAREHTRYVRHLLELLGNCRTFTGAMLDLKKQTATVQYKVGSERDALLNSTQRTDFEDVDANILQRQRKDRWCKNRSGAMDGSHMLDDVTSVGNG